MRPLHFLNALLLCSSFLFCFNLGLAQSSSQLYERVHYPPNVHSAYIQDIVFEPNGDYYVVGETSDRVAGGGEDYAYVAKHSANGQVVWEQNLPNSFGLVSFATSIDLDNNGNIYIAGQMNGCDYIINSGFITCLSTSGNTIWRNEYTSQSFDTTYHFSAIKFIANSSPVAPDHLVVGFDNYFMLIQQNGQTIDFLLHPGGRVFDLANDSDLKVVAGCENGIVDLTLLSPFPSNFYPTPKRVNNLAFLPGSTASQDQIFYQSDNHLFKMDHQYTLQDSISWNLGPTGFARQMASDDSSVCIIASDSIYRVDASFQPTHRLKRPGGSAFYASTLGLQPNPQTQNSAYLVIAGGHGRGTMVQSMDFNGNHNSTGSDLRIVSTRTANEIVGSINNVSYDAWVTISNDGLDTVNYCRFFAYTQTRDICGGNSIFPQFPNLAIPPGDSMEFFLGTILDQNNAGYSPQLYSLNLCVLAPNASLDYVQAGNCYPLRLDAFVDVEESLGTPAFQIYPNPVQDRLAIQQLAEAYPGTSLSEQEFHLLDLQGRLLKSGNLVGEKTIVELDDLPTGVYIVRIGEWTEKIVKW